MKFPYKRDAHFTVSTVFKAQAQEGLIQLASIRLLCSQCVGRDQ